MKFPLWKNKTEVALFCHPPAPCHRHGNYHDVPLPGLLFVRSGWNAPTRAGLGHVSRGPSVYWWENSCRCAFNGCRHICKGSWDSECQQPASRGVPEARVWQYACMHTHVDGKEQFLFLVGLSKSDTESVAVELCIITCLDCSNLIDKIKTWKQVFPKGLPV